MKLVYILLFTFLSLNIAAKELSFDKDIRPILSNKCFSCHGFDGEKRDANLRLDTFEGATANLGGYSAIIPGKSHLSELIKRVESEDEDDIMPPEGDALTQEQITKLKLWINQGAKYERLWSYKNLTKPKSSQIKAPNVESDIDKFVLNKLLSKNLTFSEQATPAILIRRASLDLTGLPPSVNDVIAFEENPSNTAYELYINKLLQSKNFGERWATHWLDLARYGDSNGYQHDQRRTVWPYRDWVIKAFNDGMPFDQFTKEQIAGDLLKDPSHNQLIATGFNRCGPINIGGGSKVEETKYDLAKDRVNTIGTIFLGATLECAQCHNHKFDPITQKDYYRLLAYFYSSEEQVVPLTEHGAVKRVFGGEFILDTYPKDIKDHQTFANELIELGAKTVEANRIAIQIKQGLIHPTNGNELIKLAEEYQSKTLKMIEELDATYEHRMLIMREDENPKKAHILYRGNYTDKRESVSPGTPSSLHPLKPHKNSTRLELADWLVSKNNPLTARVIVNRLWEQLFGSGIVTTTEDFGFQGEQPSHPELLDWLASDFRDHWSIKKTLKTIMLSKTYKQSSNYRNVGDPTNRLLSRGPSKRLNAEFIRDNILSIAGLLNMKMGGPPIFPEQPDGIWKEILGNLDKEYPTSSETEGYRRSIYIIWRRGALHPILSTFDAPSRNTSISQRSSTNTPLQALVTMNEPLLIRAAESFAKNIKNHQGTIENKIYWAFRSAVSRAPSDLEIKILKHLKAKIPNENKAWFFIAHTILNLDEVVRNR